MPYVQYKYKASICLYVLVYCACVCISVIIRLCCSMLFIQVARGKKPFYLKDTDKKAIALEER